MSPEPTSTIGTLVPALGGAFMSSRYAKAAADEQDLAGVWTSYFAGSAGVLGDVHADVVTAWEARPTPPSSAAPVPYQDPVPYSGLRARVQRRTQDAASRTGAVLEDAELAELARGLEMAGAHLRARATLGGP